MATPIKFNVKSDIDKNIPFLTRQVEEIRIKALTDVSKQILDDCSNVYPKVPYDTGVLEASKKFQIYEDSVEIGFTAPYSAAVHEMIKSKTGNPINWKRPGSGPKFLSTKLANPNLNRTYGKLLSNNIMISLKVKFGNIKGIK